MNKGQILLNQALKEMEMKKPNLKKVFLLLEESAERNNYESLYAIGSWYLHGKFVKKNPALAVKYFTKSIEGNYSNAYYDLAICYENGEGIKKNLRKAFVYYLNAALFGNKQSNFEVGRCYYYGIGISKNRTIGNVWFKVAEGKK